MIGRILGNYEIIEKIGEGGMGEVYRAIDTTIEREVAIKVLRSQLTANDQLVSRFRGEAVALARLQHPNIAMLYGFFRHEEVHFMALEYISGERLDKRIKRYGKMPFNDTIRVFSQILGAIGYAHRRKIIHRDIKPNNIIIAEGEEVKVMDFGIARVVGTERITREGLIVGTLEYMAPEQIRGKEPSPQTDIYAIGILLYEMFAGRLPFTCQTDYEMIRAHIELPPLPLREFAPNLPAYVENAVMRALEKNPGERFKDTDEFRNALFTGVTTIPVIESGMIVPDQTETRARTTDETRKSASTGVTPLPRATPGKVDEQVPKAGASQTDPDTNSQRQTVITSPPTEPSAERSNSSSAISISPLTEAVSLLPSTNQVEKVEKGGRPARLWLRPLMMGGAGIALILIAGAIIYAIYFGDNSGNNTTQPSPRPSPPSAPSPRPSPPSADMIKIDGGSFRLGRADEPKENGPEDYKYGLYQWPDNSKQVASFEIDRTEVTNREYAEFIDQTNYTPPKDWSGRMPPAGRELWPVRYVSFNDAVMFATWRSQRDKVRYRLPTEEEWEYAAKGQINSRYPWGEEWTAGLANIYSAGPQAVGTAKQDVSPTGVQDVLGNVAEWTTSSPRVYDLNVSIQLFPKDVAGRYVVRGGSFRDKHDGKYPVRLTVRRFILSMEQLEDVGFRLVRQLQ